MTLPEPSTAAVAALAPSGTLRAAINLSNVLLITGTGADGEPQGVSPDMAAALATRLGVDLELLRYESPGAVADDAASGTWDIGNIGAEPQRAEHIHFTAAYAEIDATCLVRADSDITSIDQVDQPGRTVVSAARTAYGLWLARNLTRATLHRSDDKTAVHDLWVDGGHDALAGLRPGLLTDLERTPGARLLDGRFTAVRQAVGTPRGRDEAGIDYLHRFVEAAKASGLVAELIARHGVHGRLSVAPPAAGATS
ncbi:MAG: transporter substrate-binding domain-containing protein [Actinomycetota bacterium]